MKWMPTSSARSSTHADLRWLRKASCMPTVPRLVDRVRKRRRRKQKVPREDFIVTIDRSMIHRLRQGSPPIARLFHRLSGGDETERRLEMFRNPIVTIAR
jgi:hypothetical protein